MSQDDAPEKTRETLEFWDDVKSGVYDIFISAAVVEEIDKCAPAKREFLLERLSEIEYTEIETTSEIETLGQKIIESGILPTKARVDSFHIACAIATGCHYIASWNMKHMANIKTNRGVRLLTIDGGYNEISIVTPAMFKKGDTYGT